jgi:hypothetical protein
LQNIDSPKRILRKRSKGLPLLTCLSLCLFCFPGQGLAKPKAKANAKAETSEATRHLKEGLKHYEAARYEEARESFRLGYEIEPRAEFLFAMGQTERLSGDCRSALHFYKRFLDTKPAKLHFDLVTQMITKCEVALSSSPIAPEEQVKTKEVRIAVPGPERTRLVAVDYRPWHREPIGVTLLSTGVVSLAAGGTFLAMANKKSDATSYQAHQSHLKKAKRNQTVGVVGLAAGGALLGSAAVYYLTRDKEATGLRNLSLSVADDQVSAGIRGSF